MYWNCICRYFWPQRAVDWRSGGDPQWYIPRRHGNVWSRIHPLHAATTGWDVFNVKPQHGAVPGVFKTCSALLKTKSILLPGGGSVGSSTFLQTFPHFTVRQDLLTNLYEWWCQTSTTLNFHQPFCWNNFDRINGVEAFSTPGEWKKHGNRTQSTEQFNIV